MAESFLYLTTTGRTSGLPRRIEIWFVERAGRHYIVSERREGSGWVKNLSQDPRVSFSVGPRDAPASVVPITAAQARIVDAANEPDLERQLDPARHERPDSLARAGLVDELPGDEHLHEVRAGGPTLLLDGRDEIAIEADTGALHDLFHRGGDGGDVGPHDMAVLDVDERDDIPRPDSHLPPRRALQGLFEDVAWAIWHAAASNRARCLTEPERQVPAEGAAQHLIGGPIDRAEEGRLIGEAPQRQDVAAVRTGSAPEHLAELRCLFLDLFHPLEEDDEGGAGRAGAIDSLVPGDRAQDQVRSAQGCSQALQREVVQLDGEDDESHSF